MKFSDRESKVPKHNYPDSFSEQIKSLEKDSILERLNQSRLTYKDVNYAKFNEYLDILRKELGELPYEIPLK